MPREGKYEGMFHCGHWMESQFLVMRLKHQGLFTYAIFVQRYTPCTAAADVLA